MNYQACTQTEKRKNEGRATRTQTETHTHRAAIREIKVEDAVRDDLLCQTTSNHLCEHLLLTLGLTGELGADDEEGEEEEEN